MIVYKATNKINGKSYIGQTSKSLNERIYHHIWRANNSSKTYFHNALMKYGNKNFTWEILSNCSKKESNKIEKLFIQKYGDYNIAEGGEGGDTLSNHPLKNEIREKIKESNKKTWELKTEKEMNKIRENARLISIKAWQDGKIGNKKWSENRSVAMKKAWKISNKLKNLKKNLRKIRCKKWKLIDPNNKKIIIINLTDFCKQNNLTQSLMIRVANKERNHHKGWYCERLGGFFADSEMNINGCS